MRKIKSVTLLKDLPGIKAETKLDFDQETRMFISIVGLPIAGYVFTIPIEKILDYPKWFKVEYEEKYQIIIHAQDGNGYQIGSYDKSPFMTAENCGELSAFLAQTMLDWLANRCECGGALVSCKINNKIAGCEHSLPWCKGCSYFNPEIVKCKLCGKAPNDKQKKRNENNCVNLSSL